ncbi:MAG: PAS domain S-box protein, partial [Syntrophales bacterium]|nr:PAS domain S-box protein [Syntrophales bacterium]
MKALSKNIAGRDSRKIPANRLLRRFHDLLEYLDDILVEIDREGRVLYITPNVEKFLGYKSEEIVGKLPTEFMPPEEAAERYSLFLELASSGQKLTFMEMTYLHKEGRRFRVEANAAPYFGSKGQLLGYIGVVRDITGRKRMEEELRANQRDLNHAQAVAHTGSWRLNVRQNKLLWSNETHRIFGIPEGTHMDYETFLSAVHPEDREHVDRCWKAALDGVPYDIEHRIIVGGTFKWVRERAELELDPEGVLLGGFGTVQDITDRKQMEEALRESEEKFRSAFDKGAVPMAITGLDSRIVLANSAFSRMLGYSESELAGVSIYGFTHPDDIQVNAAGLAPVMTGGQDSFRMEKRYIRKDGRVVWVDMSTASARGSNG